jgi:predicted metalloprotease
MNAAAKIGDDALQRASGGAVVPESFTHGSSAQRQRWFNTGLKTASVKACDTFSAAALKLAGHRTVATGGLAVSGLA